MAPLLVLPRLLTERGLDPGRVIGEGGIDLATPVVQAIGAERASTFTGRITKVTVEVKSSAGRSEGRLRTGGLRRPTL